MKHIKTNFLLSEFVHSMMKQIAYSQNKTLGQFMCEHITNSVQSEFNALPKDMRHYVLHRLSEKYGEQVTLEEEIDLAIE